MTRKYLLICVSLLISLFIYLFYRTERTLVNEIAIRLISLETYTSLRAYIASTIPLNDIVIYSLPEGLWIFCISITSKPYYIKLNGFKMDCIYIPLMFCVGMELLQLFHITNGQFDLMDIGVSAAFWALAVFGLKDKTERQNVFTGLNFNMMICLTTYGIVYLAHVFK